MNDEPELDMTGDPPVDGAERSHLRRFAALLLVTQMLFSLAGSFCRETAPVCCEILQFASYLLPILLFVLHEKKTGHPLPLRPVGRALRVSLPLLPLFFLCVIGTADLTALLLPPSDVTAAQDLTAGNVIRYAILPAVLEEGLFRLSIFSLLDRSEDRRAILATAILFSVFHGNLYQLPYAFVGGLFLTLVLACGGSIVPAALFHLLNNLLSLSLSALPDGAAPVIYGILALLSAAAVVYLWRHRADDAYRPLSDFFTRAPGVGWLFSPLGVIVLLMLISAILRV